MSRALMRRLARLEAGSAGPLSPVIINGADRADCDEQIQQARDAGRITGREPVLILVGIPRTFRSTL
jgi:hypothetical protein